MQRGIFMRKLLLTCLLVFSGFAVQAQQPTAPDIFKKVVSVYAGCRSYSDEGTASFKLTGLPFGDSGRQAHFHTAFISPDRFRFDVENGGKSRPWIVWKDGDPIRTSSEPMFLFTTQSLDNALMSLAAFSFGSSLTVPQLLLPKSLRTANFLSVISNPEVTGEEKID